MNICSSKISYIYLVITTDPLLSAERTRNSQGIDLSHNESHKQLTPSRTPQQLKREITTNTQQHVYKIYLA